MQEITEQMILFFNQRTNAHIQSVNYFANILGCSFPDHDKSKFLEPELPAYIILSDMKRHEPVKKDEWIKMLYGTILRIIHTILNFMKMYKICLN